MGIVDSLEGERQFLEFVECCTIFTELLTRSVHGTFLLMEQSSLHVTEQITQTLHCSNAALQ